VAIEQERLRLAEEFQRATRERVRGGRETPAQELRAGVALSTATIARERAAREAAVALRALAVLLAAREVEIGGRADAWFGDIGRPPGGLGGTAALAGGRPDANPDAARLEDTVARAQAALELEQRRATPDVTVSGAVRRYREASDTAYDTAFVLGVSVPLPVFDRNQGGVARAGAELTRTELTARQTRLALAASLADARQRLEASWREADALRRTVVPAAEQAFRFARDGYAEGRFSFLEVLDAQRTLFDARAQLNDALREYHTRRAEADRLSGGSPAAPAETIGGRR
jgi:cobalt-zinc-cadmium efflux system outer membrane protein